MTTLRLAFAGIFVFASTWAACGGSEADAESSTQNVEASKAAKKKKAKEAATDGAQNGTETDVDCGGEIEEVPRCADGKHCATGTDCESRSCGEGTCLAPSPTDGVRNGDETDTDCGGANAPKCPAGERCKEHSDCASDGCGYDGKCADARSCTAHFGGDTCGAGETGEGGNEHESCCSAAPVTDNGTGVLVDKYLITAGRFRQFVERTNGDIRGFIEGANSPYWNDAWTGNLPRDIGEVNFLLGPAGDGPRAGCDLNAARARTYWMSDAENAALGDGNHSPATKDMLDEKALNCVDVRMLTAFCIWDGGRLASGAELSAAWKGGENRAYPWGAGADISRVVHQFNYQWPERADLQNFIYVAAPGRRPQGNGKYGHADLAGLLFPMTSDSTATQMQFFNTGSFENHPVGANGALAGGSAIGRAYWAMGGRCARPE